MWSLPISSLFMAGHASVAVLQKLDIHTIGDLARMDPAILSLHLKSHGKMLWEYANGIDNSSIESEPSQAKGIGNSTTLASDLTTAQEAYSILLQLSTKVGHRLEKPVSLPITCAWRSNTRHLTNTPVRCRFPPRRRMEKSCTTQPVIFLTHSGTETRSVYWEFAPEN